MLEGHVALNIDGRHSRGMFGCGYYIQIRSSGEQFVLHLQGDMNLQSARTPYGA